MNYALQLFFKEQNKRTKMQNEVNMTRFDECDFVRQLWELLRVDIKFTDMLK